MKRGKLIILHGALGSKFQMQPLAAQLAKDFEVYTFNFSGHGGRPISNDLFSIELFTEDLKEYIDSLSDDNIFVFGYSMGGYVALNLASRDKRIAKVFTLGTKFNWTPETSSHEVKMLNSKKIEEKVPAFAKALKERHAPEDWKVVLNKTAEMMINLGNNPVLIEKKFASIKSPIIIARGTDDMMVSEEESKMAAGFIPNANFTSLEGFKHPIEQIDIQILSSSLLNFFQ